MCSSEALERKKVFVTELIIAMFFCSNFFTQIHVTVYRKYFIFLFVSLFATYLYFETANP